MNIIEAVKLAYEGKKIRRKSWFFIDEESCVYVYGHRGFKGDIINLVQHIEGSKEQKLATFMAEDVLAEDWEVLEGYDGEN